MLCNLSAVSLFLALNMSTIIVSDKTPTDTHGPFAECLMHIAHQNGKNIFSFLQALVVDMTCGSKSTGCLSVSMQRKVCGLIHQALLRKNTSLGLPKLFRVVALKDMA